jgi:hypothetical protein
MHQNINNEKQANSIINVNNKIFQLDPMKA